MTGFFRARRRAAPLAHRDVFAEFAMRLMALIVERRMARGGEVRPRLRAVR
jgi:hypothetical protein